jgi:predicted transcriptional regulator
MQHFFSFLIKQFTVQKREKMKTIPRRDKLKIYGDLLSALRAESSAEKVVLTKVQTKIRVPFDRLKTYITELFELGLIQDETL